MKHITSSAALAAGAFLLASTAIAAPPAAQYSAKDIIDTFAKPPEPAAAATAGGGECEKKGMVTGDDGVCEPMKNTRGFSLPSRGTIKADRAAPPSAAPSRPATAAAPTATQRPVRVATAGPIPAPAPPAHRDLLITFKLGSAELTDQARSNAKVFAEALSSPVLAGSRFEIGGYTDASGDKDRNLILSEQRADSVRTALMGMGVDGSRLVAHGYGASNFAAPSQPKSAQNRRVEAKRLE